METSILYLGTPNLNEVIRSACLHWLRIAADGKPIIYMHQDPTLEISGINMYRQIKRGLEQITTPFVAIAEHDCVYSAEHFAFVPPNDLFWYNQNSWLLQYKNPNHPEFDGLFSYWPQRRVQSQLICSTERLREVTELQIAVVGDPQWSEIRGKRPVGEPGTVGEKALRLTEGSQYAELHARIKDYLVGFQARDFHTKTPNVDIRHGNNFTGPRRGRNKIPSLSPWGTVADVLRMV